MDPDLIGLVPFTLDVPSVVSPSLHQSKDTPEVEEGDELAEELGGGEEPGTHRLERPERSQRASTDLRTAFE